jgi:sec-independent protein translocase protein TatC
MRNFFSGLWRVILFPFRLIFNIIAFPFRMVMRFFRFLNTEPEERPITEVFADLATNSDTRQMMWDQVEALRMHLLRSVIALTIAVFIAFRFSKDISILLASPLGQSPTLEAIEVTEGISVFMKIALMGGVALAIPYILFEMWLFIAPGLRPQEKKYGLVGIPFATALFICGVGFAYYILPSAFTAIREFNDYMGFASNWRPNSYYGFVVNLMLWMGVFFEFPLVIYIMTAMGIVKPKFLAQQWRLAIVLIAIIAAAITPTVDPVNMGLVMIPMILLYFVSIGLSFIAYAGRRKKNAEAENADLENGSGLGGA